MVIKILEIIFLPILALIIGIFFMGLGRKIMARIHWRYGPPLLQPVIDIIKLFHQQSISHGFMFTLGVFISLAGCVAVILFIPFGPLCPLSSSGGLLVILYIMLLIPLGMALSGGEGANPNISIGISRKLILSLSYEVPLLLVLLSVMTHYNTISIVKVVEAQNKGWAIFNWPLCLSGIAYFLILPAILGIRPFDVVTAPQEIASGPSVEYGGRYLGLVNIEHAFSLFISIALFVDLFLGGGTLWGNVNSFLKTGPGIVLAFLVFFLKLLVVFVLGLFINAVFPRFRLDQAIKYLWKLPTLLALIGLIITLVLK